MVFKHLFQHKSVYFSYPITY